MLRRSPDLQDHPVPKGNPDATERPVRRDRRAPKDLLAHKAPLACLVRAVRPDRLGRRDPLDLQALQATRRRKPLRRGRLVPRDRRGRSDRKGPQGRPGHRGRRDWRVTRDRRVLKVRRGHEASLDRLVRRGPWDHPAPWEPWVLSGLKARRGSPARSAPSVLPVPSGR